jgi:hypothetical protein
MKRLLLLSIILSWSYVSAQDCTDAYTTDIYTDVTMETVKFGEAVNSDGENQELRMDIYIGDGNVADDRPLIILAFGGAFIAGERTSSDMVYFATEFAKKGYVCASIDYRITDAFSLLAEENLVKTVVNVVHDGKAAIRYFRKDAATVDAYKIDTAAVFIGGTSAGGILSVHLAYLDDYEKLPVNWRPYVDDLPNALEGESGNPGYCSVPNGVFAFAGAIADTSWFENNDVPLYNIHSTQDQTVAYESGKPLNGLAPITLYGGFSMHERMTNLGVHSVFDSYIGDEHPPFNGTEAPENERRLLITEDNLALFLNNIIHCNPNNLLAENVQTCANSSVTVKENALSDYLVYPNPSEGIFNIKNSEKFSEYSVVNQLGQIILSGYSASSIDATELESGMYILKLNGKQSATIRLMIE